MAAWQFDLNAVSAASGTSLPAQLRADVETFLSGIMDRSNQAEGWAMYGAVDGNRIDVAFDEEGCEVDIRIDARTEADSFVGLVCLLMSTMGCTLYCAELDEFVSANAHAVKAALQRSEAWRFALDPGAFLASKVRG